MPRAPTPIESFGPELLAALLAGAKATHVIRGLTYRGAVKLRQRIYQLRAAMRAANHEMASQVSRTRIQIAWPKDAAVKRSSRNVEWPVDQNVMCEVTISPNDSEFATALAASGIKPQEIDNDILGTPSSSSHSDGSLPNQTPSPLKDYLPD